MPILINQAQPTLDYVLTHKNLINHQQSHKIEKNNGVYNNTMEVPKDLYKYKQCTKTL